MSNIIELHKKLKGKTLEEARPIAKEMGYSRVRACKSNGEALMVTRDLISSRVNVALVDGKIVYIEYFG